jgi:transcriptional regulator with GAF, ATPase, and Fis domain
VEHDLTIFSLRQFYQDCKNEEITFHTLVEYFGVQVWDYDILFGNETEDDFIPEEIKVISSLNLIHIEKQAIFQALKSASYVQKDAAALLGISQRSLNYKIAQLGITHPNWKKNI